MKINVFKEDDRLTVASILIKNGYTVRQGKEKKKPDGKTYVYYVETVEEETQNDG